MRACACPVTRNDGRGAPGEDLARIDLRPQI
jgi:hypothetical protein